MDKHILDIYSDYLISSFSFVTATGLSEALDGSLSHDKVTRFLSADDYDSKQLWQLVKPTIRQVESEKGVIIFDDVISAKPHTDESELICSHWDHANGRYVKGMNIVSCLYHDPKTKINIPTAFEPIIKPNLVTDPKTGKIKRKSDLTKNERLRRMLDICVYQNHIQFSFIVADVWYASKDNMIHIKQKLNKNFVMPIKTNRLIAFSKEEKLQGNWQQVQSTDLEAGKAYPVWVKELPFPVLLVKQVFVNENDSEGILYLVCSDTNQSSESMLNLYSKRWNIEPQYKSLKSNLGMTKSPTQATRTQQNHVFACFFAYFKLEKLRLKTNLNHFALKSKLYLKAVQASMNELQLFKEQYAFT